jgi:excinuclease ABC subunit C
MNQSDDDLPPDEPFEDDELDASSLAIDFEPILDEAELGTQATQQLKRGREVVLDALKHAPIGPGVYRMLAQDGSVLYVGKAKSIKKRIVAYTRPQGLTARIIRMVASTVSMEFVVTKTETEALLLEANLIKQLKPRFNVLLRDDKSFPYILLTGDHDAPQIVKHRGARGRKGDYFGPFASTWAVGRTITALQKAFLLRTCSDNIYESRTRPCLLFQIKRCAGPCTGEVSASEYAMLVQEARDFLSGKSQAVRGALAQEMEQAAERLDYERAARLRDRLAALAATQSSQGINPMSVVEADVFALHQEGGQNCVEVFFFRAGQNWGNRAYFPRADATVSAEEVLDAFLGQFYQERHAPALILTSHEVASAALLEQALSERSGHKVTLIHPRRGEKRDLVEQALTNAREALGRKLAEASSQTQLLKLLGERLGFAHPLRRVEIYDNSHIQGTNAIGAMVVVGFDGFVKGQYRTFNIKSADLTPGDDFGMMREVLTRRFERLKRGGEREGVHAGAEDSAENVFPDWPDLIVIDGGVGQLSATMDVLKALEIQDQAVLSISKGPNRNAGDETFHMPDRDSFKLPPRDPVLYFLQRMRDEAHRFAIGAHRKKRARDVERTALDDIAGIGPARKRALLLHFGTAKAVSQASLEDLMSTPGVDARVAKMVHDFFQN